MTLILMTVWGACVGSFLNVVIYRLPEGLSVVSPPSRCPKCEKKLAAYDNIPILGWLWLRGKCRFCKEPISIQYPIVELVTALLFGGLVYGYYFTNLRPSFDVATVGDSWSVLAVHLVLVAAMVAATMIDAKLYIIPLSIPWLASLVALVVLPLSVAMGWVISDDVNAGLRYEMLVPVTDMAGLGVAFGGTAGLLIAVALLWKKILPMSFAEEPELPEGADPDDPNMMAYHPHPRREVSKELLFLLFPIVGALIGLAVTMSMGDAEPSPLIRTIGGVLLGYLGGGGIVWGTRLLGTYMFGKEAMGLGDVHLMAAVGAVIGWRDTTLAFFIAPFFGLAAAVIMAGVSALVKGQVRVIPYGPYLCGAAYLVMLYRMPILRLVFP